MKFLAVDTSGVHLVVAAYRDGASAVRRSECALRHSVLLMDEIDAALSALSLAPADCDFFACVAGPGSFTGIRIGIATVKGLCLALGRPAVAVTSFDVLAYAEGREKLLALVDAGHGAFYACPYENGRAGEGAYRTAEEVAELQKEYPPVTEGDPDGLVRAVLAHAEEQIPAGELKALYLRRSAAEEGR